MDMILFGERGFSHTNTRTIQLDAHKLLIWVTLTLDNKHPNLAVRPTNDLVELCLFNSREMINNMTLFLVLEYYFQCSPPCFF